MEIGPNFLKLSADVAEINKNEEGHLGVSIGGGHPFCPCLYVVQIFEGSPVAMDGRISLGDEIFAINGINVKGCEKTAVAKLIQQTPNPIKISFNKLCFDAEQGQTLDIALKKIKHWFVESMDVKTADALGLSRAMLCNDLLTKLMDKLEVNAQFYKQLIKKCQIVGKNYENMSDAQQSFGSILNEVALREREEDTKKLFFLLGNSHKMFTKEHAVIIRKIEEVVKKLQIYVDKAIPDTKASIRKYLDVKYEYLSYCLKIKEMEDEEVSIAEGDYVSRIETGNYEYRVILRCCEAARRNFIEVRKHVMVKIQMLDEKHVRELAMHLLNLIDGLSENHSKCFSNSNKN